MAHPPHMVSVQEGLARIDSQSHEVLQVGMRVLKAANGALFPLDLMVQGALKRHLSTAAAFDQLVRAWNIMAARALLRMHIDNSLRFSAAWFVDDPHDLARSVLKGAAVRDLNDRDGKRLTDRNLVRRHSAAHPWLPTVYDNLSGYVHFSGAHMVAPYIKGAREDGVYPMEISAQDLNLPEESWIEIIECFLESTEILLWCMADYARMKQRVADLEAGQKSP